MVHIQTISSEGAPFLHRKLYQVIFSRLLSVKFAEFERCINEKIVIKNNVWIGANVIIKHGVHIGTGCVVGMGAIVTKDLPPYTIAVGNPAKVLRSCFSDDIVHRLLISKWWILDDEDLRMLAPNI